MNLEPNRSGHLSDDDLIVSLYCAGEERDSHVSGCLVCQRRVDVLRANRERVERAALPACDVSSDLLATQRRNIYAQLSPVQPWWRSWAANFEILRLLQPKWISAGATVLALAGGLLVFEHRQDKVRMEDRISDVELAQEVSSLSQRAEAPPTEPLKALFE